MRSGQSFSTVHYDRQAMTDITLGLMQDTGWCAPLKPHFIRHTDGQQVACS